MTRELFVDAVSELDARTDENIKKYFVSTGAIQRIRAASGRSFAVVGLKGTGKTTLFRSLVEDWARDRSHHTFGLTTETVAFETYIEKVNCLQFESSVRTGMLLYLLQLIDKNISEFSPENDLPGWIDRKNKILDPKGKAFDLLKRFQGFSILGAGLSLRDGKKVETFRPLPQRDQTSLLSLLRDFGASGRRIRIIVDDPDRLFTRGTSVDSHLLAGYVLGSNWVAKQLGFVQFVHVLKSSVYDQLRQVEEMSNLPYDFFRHISWTKPELAAVLRSRLSFSGVVPSTVFADDKDLSIATFADLIRNGPRDLLRYVEIILKSADDAVVSTRTINEQASAFKEEARLQMSTVYSNIYSGVESFADAIFETFEPISIGDFLTRFEVLRMELKPRGLNYGQPWLLAGDRALRALVDAGIVDVRVRGKWLRPFEPDYVRFDSRSPQTSVRRNSVFVQ